jgi:hypothetical protein
MAYQPVLRTCMQGRELTVLQARFLLRARVERVVGCMRPARTHTNHPHHCPTRKATFLATVRGILPIVSKVLPQSPVGATRSLFNGDIQV